MLLEFGQLGDAAVPRRCDIDDGGGGSFTPAAAAAGHDALQHILGYPNKSSSLTAEVAGRIFE
jgi:hypothetical protein